MNRLWMKTQSGGKIPIKSGFSLREKEERKTHMLERKQVVFYDVRGFFVEMKADAVNSPSLSLDRMECSPRHIVLGH